MSSHDQLQQQSLSPEAGVQSPQRMAPAAASFVDQRPAALAQRKLQQEINQSPRVSQFAQMQALANQGPAGAAGLPPRLKAGIEGLSGLNMDTVQVHYNSAKPAQLAAHAYAQGTNIYLAPGQAKHLPHEAWHVVQQLRGQVKPTLQLQAGISVNDDAQLEHQADVMGHKALQLGAAPSAHAGPSGHPGVGAATTRFPVQGLFIFPAIDASKFQSEFHATSFAGRVSVLPIHDDASGTYTSAGVWVRQVKLSDDRPPTKFGTEGQRSHTVAWTLLRTSMQKLGDQTLDQFIAIIKAMITHMDHPANSPKATLAATALHTGLMAGLTIMADGARKVAIAEWQQEASDLLTDVVHYYQLSEAATYADGQAVGHGESSNMATLQVVESASKFGDLSQANLSAGLLAASAMFDAKSRLTHKVLAQVLHHWLLNLHLAFPAFARKYHADLVKSAMSTLGIDAAGQLLMTAAFGSDFTLVSHHVLGKSMGLGITSDHDGLSFAIPSAHQSTFVANVKLKGGVGTAGKLALEKRDKTELQATQVGVAHYASDQISIERLKVADDRPDTRFGHLQRSHTVAWTFVRRHLMGFAGQSLHVLLNFMLHELGTLKEDIDSPQQNSKIRFDASGTASSLRSALQAAITNKHQAPLHQWQAAVSELVETYVTLYQLSRSATYAKEERPQGHGEASAIGNLVAAEQALTAMVDDKAKKKYMKKNALNLAKFAVKLLDAVIGNGNLQPQQWRNAVLHWFALIKQSYPELVKHQVFLDECENRISLAEPEANTLVGYAPSNDKEKLLVNLYESAKNEISAFPDIFQKDLKTCIRLRLNADGYVPPDYDVWDKMIDGLNIPIAYRREWSKVLLAHMRNTKRGVVKPIPQAKHTDDNTPSIEKLSMDVNTYLARVRADHDTLSQAITENFIKKSQGKPNEAYVATNAPALKESIKNGMTDAIQLSSLSEIDNFKKWFELLVSVKGDMNYQNILAKVVHA
ncbi:MAG: DUF4157 domain-containing protein [Massilia sp.]